ncbi:hypothetical protein BU16DRAFT_615203 [Lophium mytilinum]|uniref:ATP-dependent DNA helicase n=1 Tax=Lophium mytilinum TaxID=390894 RepID=A0A6A6R5J4_9PEZI|nr:hypothetical protein BU16DRAFT_615203 [Lophium mytilinum]
MACLNAVATVHGVLSEGAQDATEDSSTACSKTFLTFITSHCPTLFNSVDLMHADLPERIASKSSTQPGRKRSSPSPGSEPSSSAQIPGADGDLNLVDAGIESPQKRRRLNTTVANTAHYTSIVLARISIDLHFPNDPSLFSNKAVYEPVELSLRDFIRTEKEQFSITLPAGSEPGIVLTGSSISLDEIEDHMKKALNLPSPKGKAAPIAFSRCIIQPPRGSRPCFRLETQIGWNVGLSVVNSTGRRREAMRDYELLSYYLPVESTRESTPWSLQDFYETVHVPAMDRKVSSAIQTPLLESKLYPFQQRAVDWLLRREGVEFNGQSLAPYQAFDKANILPASFHESKDAMGTRCYVSHSRGLVMTEMPSFQDLRGGILAEEMGLGKTVELIALICLHTRTMPTVPHFVDQITGNDVTASGSTLIITPNSILQQWKNELSIHAPHLKVFHYQGLPTGSADKPGQSPTVDQLLEYDVVLTTYYVLSKEIHYANAPPKRIMRHERRFELRRSPLVQISWWRVCLDEAQMVESGVSNAATVAKQIPRCNAWAVSGTPLRKDVQDLRGLLIFLRYEPYASSKQHWSRVDKATFKQIFGRIAMRHTKDKIRHELRLPPQKRVVITVPFTTIEEQNYSELIKQMCQACGFSSDGDFLDEQGNPWDPTVLEKMREWLVRLRQTCLHAQVGRRNRRALGRGNAPLRTVEEVLEVMIEQNDTLAKAGEREVILLSLGKGHALGNVKFHEMRSVRAQEVYLEALKEASRFVQECRDELEAEIVKQGTASIARGRSVSVAADQESDGDGEDKNKQDEGSDRLARLATIKKSLRSALELEHACNFFVGTSYFQIKENKTLTVPDSEEFHQLEKSETEYYANAKAIRKELLRESQESAMRRMKKIEAKVEKEKFAKVPHIKELADYGGIENRKVLDMMDRLSDVMNEQTAQIDEWRMKVVSILLLPLVDEDEGKETTGDEYEDSTKVQDDLYVYIAALRAILADRNLAITGLSNELIDHEMRTSKKMALEGKGHAPELTLKIMDIRDKLKPNAQDGSLKGAISSVRTLVTNLQWQADGGNDRARTELKIVEKELAQIQAISTAQTKALAELEKEQELFRTTMNRRLEFYRQLQHISDTVAPWKEEMDEQLDVVALARQQKLEVTAKNSLARTKAKQRFLLHLREENKQEGERICVICQSEFENGVLTICGHQFCKECIQEWYKAHRTCPICKRRLHNNDFHDITYKPQEIRAQEETHENESQSLPSSPGSAQSSIYSDISSTVMNEIKSIDLPGASYGTKVDTIARHLLWIRKNDPGARSIIFSQFSDFLDVLRKAFESWKIGCSSIGEKHGIEKFKADASTECFLLDAKSDSSGLNLVNATYVFLCEPLINPAIELQAIARVHRIGQERPTTVYMYLVSDTVEEAIYDISVSRRLEHMSQGRKAASSESSSGTATPSLQENAIDAANSLELQQAPLKQLMRKKGDGEVVGQDDLWKCLFGKPRKHQTEPSEAAQAQVDRHLRATAAEGRATAGEGRATVGEGRATVEEGRTEAARSRLTTWSTPVIRSLYYNTRE